MRAFFAVDLDDAARREAAAAAEALLEGNPGWRRTRAENLHLTVAFLGEIDERTLFFLTKELPDALLEIEPFTLALAGAGRFPDRVVSTRPSRPAAPRVLWLGVREGRESLERLAAAVVKLCAAVKLSTGAGFAVDGRPLVPHLTIARAEHRPSRQGRGRGSPAGGGRLDDVLDFWRDRPVGRPFEVREVVLYESVLGSGGPVYAPRLRAPLGGSLGSIGAKGPGAVPDR